MKKNLTHLSIALFLIVLSSLSSVVLADDDITGEAMSACPDNSQLVNGVCECDAGLEFDSNTEECIDADEWCLQEYGEHVYYDGVTDLCACESDYAWIEELNSCVTLDEQCKHEYGESHSYVDGVCQTTVSDGGEGEGSDLFSDVSESHANWDAISYLYEAGVIEGYDDGTYKPDQTVNRAELLKIIIEGKGFTPSMDDFSNCFDDVAEDWYAPYVCYAQSVDWVEGYDDGTYRPGNPVNNVEALKILLLAYEVEVPESVEEAPFDDVPTDIWYAKYVSKAQELELLEEDGGYFSPGKERTRAEIAENLYRLLK